MKKENNSTGNKPEILIAEDSTTQSMQLKHFLEIHNYTVTVAQNGKQALKLLTKNHPSLVISDIIMPEMDGYELCKKIKSDKNTGDIPVILLTVLTDPDEIIEGLSCGADSFITKPYNEDYLLSHIERIISRENEVFNEKVPFSAQILFNGKKRLVQAEQQNVINLMLSIYEGAIHQNEKLLQTQEELRLLNERLESLVEERTSDLSEEIKLSNEMSARLKESEEKWRKLVTTIPDYIGLYDCDGGYLFMNHNTNGFSKQEVIGKSLFDFISDESKEIFRQNFEKCITTGVNQNFEYSAYGDDKISATYETCLVPILQNGKVNNVMSIARDITQLKLTTETIKILARFPSENPDPVLRVDLNGMLLYANESSFKNLTWKLQIGEKIPSVLHKLITVTMNGGIRKTIDTEHDRRIISFNIVPFLEAGYANLYGRDTTDSRLAEEKLRSSEERLKILFDCAPDAYYMYDLKGNFIDGNIAAEKLMGQDRTELIGKNFLKLNLMSVSQLLRVAQLLIKNSLGQSTGPDELELNRKDGSKVTVEILTHPVKIQGQTLVLGIARDISVRKLAEESSSQTRRLLRTLIDNLPDMIYVKNIDGRKVIANKADVNNIGFSEEAEVLGKTDLELFRGKTGERGYADDKIVINSGKPIVNREEDFVNSKGERIWLLTTKIPLKNEDGKITGLVGMGRDITKSKKNELELIRAMEKAEESNRLKSAFLTNMSHEIRTPMNGILGFTELLKEPTLTNAELQEYIQTIQISGARMLNTINNIVDVSKIESGLMEVNIKETNLNEKVEFTYKFFKPEADKKGLRLIFKTGLPAIKDNIKTDNEKVYGILTNLIKNAIKFTFEGSIEFGYEKKGDFLEFYVKDTGVGIPGNQKELIFERFRQGSESHNRKYEGSGLGLSIAKSYVTMLGGDIRVESEEGKGSIFYFSIPYIPVSDQMSAIEDLAFIENKEVLIKKLKILIVEDDEISYALLSRVVQKISKEVLHAMTGIEAIEACRKNADFDLILMDIRMPQMNGLEATQLIRQFNKNVIIIAQSAYGFSDDFELASNAGCNDYITKPINKTLLFEIIKKHIKN